MLRYYAYSDQTDRLLEGLIFDQIFLLLSAFLSCFILTVLQYGSHSPQMRLVILFPHSCSLCLTIRTDQTLSYSRTLQSLSACFCFFCLPGEFTGKRSDIVDFFIMHMVIMHKSRNA
ncbi:hypothetical protein BV22DRAFT_121712 [Leucogyrophana mollusca]|uniref:Uncharacterized protein n=1 Tax=Leucogyrophana mollusca TaxID=85980 RepID=A0ACB8BUE0_9AGAM|nr:hypothetical protein BV22DRAFT_121712 [Leucogyrophana mollusca]